MKYFEFYKERIPELPTPNDKGESVVKCVFHSDSNPSLAINVESGKWKCYTPHCPGHAGGGWRKFEQLLKGEGPGHTEIKVPPIEASAIEGFASVLKQSPTPLAILHNKRGLTDETIARFKLGWDGDRILIPIQGIDGSWLNIRKYKYGAQKDKMIAWGPRYNRARLYPQEILKASDWVLLCEGELDALLAIQLGFPAISVTGGADTWLPEFDEQLAGKRVIICYDCDKAGRQGAKRVAAKLLPRAKEVRILTLPLAGSKEEKDVTDYFITLGHRPEEFSELIDEAELVEAVADPAKSEPDAAVEEIHLSHIGMHRLVAKRVSAVALVAGKDLAPFAVPKRIAFNCASVGTEKICDACGICKSNGQLDLKVPDWSPELLQMVNVPIEKMHAQLGRMAGVPWGCHRYSFEVKEHTNIEAIKAIPEIDFNADASEYVIRALYYLGHGLETNRTYKVEGVVMPDPKNQYATALLYNAEPSVSSIEQFNLTDEQRKELLIFQVGETK